MVRARRILLEHVVVQVPLIHPALLSQTFEQNLVFISSRLRHVHGCDDAQRSSAGRLRGWLDREFVMHTLIVRALVNDLQPGPEVGSMPRTLMSLEKRFSLPSFDNDETVR